MNDSFFAVAAVSFLITTVAACFGLLDQARTIRKLRDLIAPLDHDKDGKPGGRRVEIDEADQLNIWGHRIDLEDVCVNPASYPPSR